jgi:glycosyltransferase involved in cell wall biosynthesis
MKKVCIISPAAYPLLKNDETIQSAGGAEAQFKTLGLAFKNLSYEVHFIVGDFSQQRREKISGIIVHKVPLRYLGGSNYHLIPAWINLFLTLARIKADIHIIKLPRDLLLPIGVFCKLFRKKLMFVGQIDSDVDPDFLKKANNLFSYWFFRIGLCLTDSVVAQNAFQQKGFYAVYKKRAKIISNIITLPNQEAIIRKENYILWVGNNLAKKQPDKFLNLAINLPQFEFKMIMALMPGAPDDGFIKDRLSTVPNMEYLGFVPFSQISQYFQKASLFVSTSVREGFPNTFLQAWQYGTPVVSLHVDPDDVIEKYQLGRHSGTFAALGQDVEELMQNDELRNYMGQNAKRYVEANHSIRAIVSQYLEVFEEVQVAAKECRTGITK